MNKKTLLITGATGILGRSLFLEALKTGMDIVVPVRAKNNDEAQIRLNDCIGNIDIPLSTKVDAIAADLVKPNLGLSLTDYNALITRVNYIIHSAGDVSFNSQDKQRIFNTNVNGTSNVLGLAEACADLKGLVHISTAYVCGDVQGLVLEDNLNADSFTSPYEESKYEAEKLVHLFRRRTSLPVIICRPSIILEGLEGLKRTRLPAINALILLLSRVVNSIRSSTQDGNVIRIPANPSAIADLVPIDYVTTSILKMMLDSRAYGMTFHLTNPASPTLAEFAQVLSEEIGNGIYRFECVLPSSISLSELSSAEKMLVLNIQPYLAHLSSMFSFDTKNSATFKQMGVMPECPSVSRGMLVNLIRDSHQYATQ